MDINDSNPKPQGTGGLKLMTVFVLVLVAHVLVLGSMTAYYVFKGPNADTDLAVADKNHPSVKATADGSLASDAATPETNAAPATASSDAAITPPAPMTIDASALADKGDTAATPTPAVGAPEPAATDATATPETLAIPAPRASGGMTPMEMPAPTSPATPEETAAVSPATVASTPADSTQMASVTTAPISVPAPEPVTTPEPAPAPVVPPSMASAAPSAGASAPTPAALLPPPDAVTKPAPVAAASPVKPVANPSSVATGPVKFSQNKTASLAAQAAPSRAIGPTKTVAPRAKSASVASNVQTAPTSEMTPKMKTASAPVKSFVALASHAPYTVKEGDSLDRIARNNHTSVARLKAANSLNSDLLHIGQKLLIPAKSSVVTEVAETKKGKKALFDSSTPAFAATPTSAKKAAKKPAVVASTSGSPAHYTVEKGDTLAYIAHKFKTTKRALLAANTINDPAKLLVGKKLRIPHATAGTANLANVEQ